MNMKKLLILLTLLNLTILPAFADGVDDMFGGGNNDEFDFEEPFSKENVLRAISHDAGMACKRGVCTISSTDTKWRDFTFAINSGYGQPNYGSGGGTNVFLGNVGNGNSRYGNHSLNIEVNVGTCTQKVNIPRSLYYSMNKYLYGLQNSDGTVRRSFTPADEAMIIFFTTVSKQIGNGSCRQR
jgi:hypothetical protein